MTHLNMKTTDRTSDNIEKIAELFPNCVTERLGDDGKPEKAIDFDRLRQELSKDIVEGNEERYQFTWPDKRNAIRLANAPTTMTLRPCRKESVDFDNTKNLYIEGDNLEVLKLLRENYLGKVKMIYIDPPYNTGGDFVYDDNFKVDNNLWSLINGGRDEYGNLLDEKMVLNTESNGRFHTDWLNMMYPRLKVAKDLLSDDGVIFISIDDHEVENLRKICDELFAEINCQAVITYVRKTSGKQDSSNFMKSTEFLLVYSKSSAWNCSPIIATEKVTDRFNKSSDDGRRYRETDLRKTGTGDRREDRPLMWYPFYYNPQTDQLIVRKEVDDTLRSDGFVEIWPQKPDGSEGRWRWGFPTSLSNIDFLVAKIMPKYKHENKYTIYEIDYIDKKGDVKTVKEHTFWNRTEFNSDNAMAEFKNLGFSNQLFPFPKCSEYIKHILYLSNCDNSIILDFFSGSATTAHAVMQLNAEDGGSRKFIMVQIPEKTKEDSEAYKAGYKNICEIGKERIRRAGKKIVEEMNAKNEGLFAELENRSLDTGFRVLKLDTSNMADVYYTPEQFDRSSLFADNIKDERTPEDLLFQVMPECNLPLSSKIEEKKIEGKTVFVVNESYLVACFDDNIDEKVITEIAKMKPYYFVMRDSSMQTDNVADNFEQIFNAYSKETVRRVI